ncbi:CocE/NonD family hydrolase [Granulicella arctica]|uniref:CocE/NonD family hydrolase n=1 Tax=Granulicella arctica TaxID=940613 RepID=UPI0021DF8CED|nr:CocE/NonD family hydrolase [Granulicella arctica]
MKIRIALAAVCLLFSAARVLPAQTSAPFNTEEFVRAHYAKYEYRIPMRDGVKLFTSVYVPQSGTFKDEGPYPFLMTRTPYSCAPYGEDKMPTRLGVSQELLESGYIFVCADVRGRSGSEGVFQEMSPHIDDKKSSKDVDESSDTYDTVEFLLKHVANNNGKVGITGISYPGFYTSASIIDSHPAIKAASPQAPMTDLFFGDDAYHGGAFMLGANYGFYKFFFPQKNPIDLHNTPARPAGESDPDTYRSLLAAGPTGNLDTGKPYLDGKNWLFHDQLIHTTYDDYWKKRDLSRHMTGVHAAVMTVGGWFDAEDLSGPFKTFHAIDKLSPGTVNTLVVGPWVHGGWSNGDGDRLGDATFNSKTGVFFRAHIQYPFFEFYLKGRNGAPLPKAYVFETGTNVWKQYAAWPPQSAAAKTLYFQANGGLSFTAPTAKAGVDEYVSDPAHPVPFVGYTTDTVPQRYMSDDQRFASRRPDVLTYETEPLTEDVTFSGPVKPKLKIASTGTDADFVVKLIDVYPDDYPEPPADAAGKRILGPPPIILGGYQQLVRGEPMRAKFRDSWEKPAPLVPGKMVEVNADMPDINHTFRTGHRIMVQVQSSWFPLVDRNPQTFVENIPLAKPEQFVKATESVYRNAGAASGVEVMVVP